MRGKSGLLLICGLLALIAVLTPYTESSESKSATRPAEITKSHAPVDLTLNVNGRPERLEDLELTVHLHSPESVSVGYFGDRPLIYLALSIDRFEWRFQHKPIVEPRPVNEDGSMTLFTLMAVPNPDELVSTTDTEWTFKFSELHTRDRERLERLFAGCPVTISVDLSNYQGPSTVRQYSQTLQLPPAPNQKQTPEQILQQDEARIQEEAAEAWEEFKAEYPEAAAGLEEPEGNFPSQDR